jgi:hypothetical protein
VFPVHLDDVKPLIPHCCEPSLTDFDFLFSFPRGHAMFKMNSITRLLANSKIGTAKEITQKLGRALKTDGKWPYLDPGEKKVCLCAVCRSEMPKMFLC